LTNDYNLRTKKSLPNALIQLLTGKVDFYFNFYIEIFLTSLHALYLNIIDAIRGEELGGLKPPHFYPPPLPCF